MCIVRMIHNTHLHRVGVNAVFPSVARKPGSIALDTMVPTVPDTSQSQGLVLLLTFSDSDIICTKLLHSVGN